MYFFAEKKNTIMVHLICPTMKKARAHYLESFEISRNDNNKVPTVEDFIEKLKRYRKCPSPLEGQHYEFAFKGTNPYMYNDQNKKVILGADGVPEGSNGGMAKAMAKMYNFSFNFTIYTFPGTINETSGTATSAYADVNNISL